MISDGSPTISQKLIEIWLFFATIMSNWVISDGSPTISSKLIEIWLFSPQYIQNWLNLAGLALSPTYLHEIAWDSMRFTLFAKPNEIEWFLVFYSQFARNWMSLAFLATFARNWMFDYLTHSVRTSHEIE